MPRWNHALMVALVLAGCGGKKKVQLAQADPEAAVAAFRQAAPARTLRGRFKLKISGPGVEGTTSAGLVINRPDQIRLDVNTPLGTPMLLLATDGKAMNAWVQKSATFFRGDDALNVLKELTGGVVGVADLLDILTGRLPLDGATVLDSRPVPGGVQVVLGKEEVPGYRMRAVLDPRVALVRQIEVAAVDGPKPTDLGKPVLKVRYPDVMHSEGGFLPEEMSIDLPTLGWKVDLEFHTWDVLGVVPDVFVLQSPPGAAEKDLVETLRNMAEAKGMDVPDAG